MEVESPRFATAKFLIRGGPWIRIREATFYAKYVPHQDVCEQVWKSKRTCKWITYKVASPFELQTLLLLALSNTLNKRRWNLSLFRGVWTGKDVSYKHLRVLGCRAVVHIPKYERSMLAKTSKTWTMCAWCKIQPQAVSKIMSRRRLDL